MIDNVIKWISELIAQYVLPSTMLKLSLVALIVSLPLSLILGQWVIILVLVGNNVLWLVTEYLYSKQIEDEEQLTEGDQ